jgi:ribosomal protein S18 acetylase RimI-like enzyme
MKSQPRLFQERSAVNLIRRIEVADIRAVHSIDSEIFGSGAYPYFFFRQAYELYRETFLVASLGGAIIGYCLGAPTASNRGKGWILSLAVSSNYRGQGYGSRLLSKTLETLLEMGCNEVLLSVQPSNNIAKALFQRHTFNTIQVDSEYFGTGCPREIMRVLLKKEM